MGSDFSQNKPPRICAIVVNFNGTRLTCQCVDSLLSSHYSNLKIVIVDNGSEDRPGDLFRERYPQCEVIESKQNRGYTGGVNIGLEHGLKGDADFFLVLNNDTLIEPDMIGLLVQAADEHPNAGLISPKILYLEPRDSIWYDGGAFSLFFGVSRHTRLRQKDAQTRLEPRLVSFISGCAFLIGRHTLEQVGLMDETLFHIAEDADLSVRVRKAGYDLVYIPRARLYHVESIATLKYFGSPVQLYLATRNILYVHKKHSRWRHDLVFYPYFTLRWLLYQSLKHLLRREPVMLKAMYLAVQSFFIGKMGPPGKLRERLNPPPY